MDPILREYLKDVLATTERGGDGTHHLQNIIDERIPKAVKKRLIKPLKPRPTCKTALASQANLKKRKAILEEFDPVPEINSGEIPQYKLVKEVKVGLKSIKQLYLVTVG